MTIDHGANGAAQTDVRLDGAPGLRPERQATPGSAGRRHRRQRGERLMVPEAGFGSYYGRPVLKPPTWEPRNIASYLFLGGLAGASSTLAAGAELTGRARLARAGKVTALGALGGSLYVLIADLGRPGRFLNMLRVCKVTSPMSIGSWLLAAYGPPAGVAAVTAATGLFPGLGRAATLGAGLLGPAVATYTGALIANTAVPVWHEAHREMPILFAGSALASASGMGLLAAPLAESGPAGRAALLGAATEVIATGLMKRRLGPVAEPLKRGKGGLLLRAGEALIVAGAVAGALAPMLDGARGGGGRRRRGGRRGAGSGRVVAALAGAALLAGSACTRFGISYAGGDSARDPKYTVEPQRARLSREDRTEHRDLASPHRVRL